MYLLTPPSDERSVGFQIRARNCPLAMGFDCGFDMAPPLTDSEDGNSRCLAFLDDIKDMYKADPVYQARPRVINLEIGEHIGDCVQEKMSKGIRTRK